ncbi:hypothetical protein [Methanoplanus endosymbiosus]|uniref:Uncharacterized protein n=1 Tax=Methanoplanus endosymbiosus TaxID=33865 RepID=A0A9E7TJM4_9EURY|nr:hypothetical protein [Methanoplanus endosymbiosus]UUX91875.1 hypothetical protein L6E24_10960 [Methanoplanus endosymbiosus]
MTSQFGKGFLTVIMLISKRLSLPPARAWNGLSDHMVGLEIPEQFRGTEIEEIVVSLRQKVMWHQNGQMDADDLDGVIRTMRRLVIAVDRELGITDPDSGKYD